LQRGIDTPANKLPDGQISKDVGWVERSETHHLHQMQLMGIASLNPSYALDCKEMSLAFYPNKIESF